MNIAIHPSPTPRQDRPEPFGTWTPTKAGNWFCETFDETIPLHARRQLGVTKDAHGILERAWREVGALLLRVDTMEDTKMLTDLRDALKILGGSIADQVEMIAEAQLLDDGK